MKNILKKKFTLPLVPLVCTLLLILVIILTYNIIPKTTTFTGYIPVEQLPTIKWVETSSGEWEAQGSVLVVTKDTYFVVYFPVEGSWMGSYNVIYKGTYPPTIGNKIFIKGTYRDGKPWIIQASTKDAW